MARGLGLSAAAVRLTALIAVLVWLLGRVLTDRYGWSQWLWWIPTPAAVIAAFVALLAAPSSSGKRRGRRLGWTICALSIGLYFVLIEHRFLRRTPAMGQESSNSVRVAHWNIGRGLAASLATVVMDQISAMRPDVTIITNPIYDVTDQAWLDRFAPGHQVITVVNMSVISRLPIRTARVLVAVDNIVIVQVEIDASARLGRPLVMYLVDMPSSPKIARYELARRVRRLLEDPATHGGAAPSPPDIVVGDFNITRGSASLGYLFPNMRHAFGEAGHGYSATFHRAFPLYHIDHVLVGPSLRAINYELIDPQMSRHRMQVAEVTSANTISTAPSDQR